MPFLQDLKVHTVPCDRMRGPGGVAWHLDSSRPAAAATSTVAAEAGTHCTAALMFGPEPPTAPLSWVPWASEREAATEHT